MVLLNLMLPENLPMWKLLEVPVGLYLLIRSAGGRAHPGGF